MPHKSYIPINKRHVEITKKRNKFKGHHYPIIIGGQIDQSSNRFINGSTYGISMGGGLSSLHFGSKKLPKNSANIQFIA